MNQFLRNRISLQTEPNTTQSLSDKTPANGVKPISPEQEELIHRLVYFQNEYEQPSEEDLKRISVSIETPAAVGRARKL